MQKKSTTYQNKKKKMTPLLKKENKIYFHTKDLKINKEKSKKLDHVKVESFFIKNIKKSINYELNFFVDAKVWLVFHVSFLKSTHSKTLVQITFRYQKQKNQKYEVEQILRQKGQQYLVKWKKYLITKNTWESRKNLTNCSKELRKFQKDQRTWKINHRTHLTKSLVLIKHQWRALMTRERVPLDLIFQCFATQHSSLFVARFRQISIVALGVVVWRLLLVVSQSLHEVSFLTFYVVFRVVDID